MKVHEKWYEEAEQMTLKNLPKFIEKLTTEYQHDYGTICHALAAAGIATMWAIDKSPQGGITGFQAGAIMWEIIRHWTYTDNKIGLRIINYDDLLYPQYKNKFSKTISPSQADLLKKTAKKKLKESNVASPEVMQHWEMLASGGLPFGFKEEKDY